jgi:hypothetical protein
MAHVSTDEVLSALRNVDFPASKEELLRAAREAGASDEVIRALRAIPPVEYANRNEVARSVPVDPAEELGLSPGSEASRPGNAATTARRGCRNTSETFPGPRSRRGRSDARCCGSRGPHLIFVCGPVRGEQVAALHARFTLCRRRQCDQPRRPGDHRI